MRAERTTYYWIFSVSGFSGLIYESIWTHYLKLFLGHAAYAQTLVLAIFMGGMAVGAWICGWRSARWPRLLLGYAIVEAVIGLLALMFHPIFLLTVDAMLSSVLPALGPGPVLTVAKWSLGVLLILPQSILLGMTFPLMSAGLVRRYPDAAGCTMATLYFVNSLGGSVGVLASGFWLIAAVGLPGTIGLAGVLNIALAITVGRLSRGEPAQPAEQAVPAGPAAAGGAGRPLLGVMLLIAAFTGLSSLFYEVGWIRMLSLVLGSSTHSFELMLSAFLLGLALGGWWIRRRVDRFSSSMAVLGWVQVIMGLCALGTLSLYGGTFRLMEWLMAVVPRTGMGYLQISLAGHGIASLIMMPATFCAGMTLPLITDTLLRDGQGERSIGLVYAANTIGAIVGVFVAVHLAMPLLGIKNVIVSGAIIDLGLGLLLLEHGGAGIRRAQPAAALGLAGAALILAQFAVGFDLNRMASGVFRTGQTIAGAEKAKVLFYADGKTATISLLMTADGAVQIRTNGKVDASVNMSGTGRKRPDEVTMVMTAALPVLLRPSARTAAVVGLGSGLTTHTILTDPDLERVDTIEIEPAMVSGARGFMPRNRLAYEDPRSVIAIEDAKTFFPSRSVKYDIIASEPSNPWVSGVSSLFSSEFYHLVGGFLAPDGLLVQWLNLYEIDERLVVSVLKSIDGHFPDYAIYAANEGDILVVATNAARLPALPGEWPPIPGLVAELNRVGIASPLDVALRKVGTKRSLAPLLAAADVPANSDYFPALDQNANRARFLNSGAHGFAVLTVSSLPIVEMLSGEVRSQTTQVSDHPYFYSRNEPHRASFAAFFRDYVRGMPPLPREFQPPDTYEAQAAKMVAECRQPPRDDRVAALLEIAMKVVPFLAPAEDDALWAALRDSACVGGLRRNEMDWLQLTQAVGRRDGLEMAAASGRLFAGGEDRNAVRRGYLLGTGMLGNIAMARPDQARELWATVGSKGFPAGPPDLFWRLLVAHAGAAAVLAPISPN